MSEYCERCVHTDAKIAALKERLRIVEAERDALIKDVLAIVPEPLQPKVSGESPSWHAVAAVANLNARRLNHEADLSALTERLRAVEAERDDLGAFKAYVHRRLDAAGVPAHPNGPHSAEGCRVGDRLDILQRERDEANAAIGNLQKPLDHIAKLIWGDAQGRPFAILGEAVATQLSALRAELQRKDAALKAARDYIKYDGDERCAHSQDDTVSICDAALQPKEPTVGQRQSKQQEGIEAAQRIIEIIDDKEDLNQPALFRPTIRAHAVVALDGLRDKTC